MEFIVTTQGLGPFYPKVVMIDDLGNTHVFLNKTSFVDEDRAAKIAQELLDEIRNEVFHRFGKWCS